MYNELDYSCLLVLLKYLLKNIVYKNIRHKGKSFAYLNERITLNNKTLQVFSVPFVNFCGYNFLFRVLLILNYRGGEFSLAYFFSSVKVEISFLNRRILATRILFYN